MDCEEAPRTEINTTKTRVCASTKLLIAPTWNARPFLVKSIFFFFVLAPVPAIQMFPPSCTEVGGVKRLRLRLCRSGGAVQFLNAFWQEIVLTLPPTQTNSNRKSEHIKSNLCGFHPWNAQGDLSPKKHAKHFLCMLDCEFFFFYFDVKLHPGHYAFK